MALAMVRGIGKYLLLLALGLGAGLGLVEVMLRVFQPFELRMRGDEIDLWPGREYVFELPDARQLDTVVYNTNNSIGFRGPEPPAEPQRYLTIIAVGGSTTEGMLLSDGKTWPDVLGRRLAGSFDRVWVNNAGLGGQSTFGHLVMMDDHVIERAPKVVLFLVGVNDVGLGQPKRADMADAADGVNVYSLRSWAKTLTGQSYVAALGLNIYRSSKAKRLRVLDEGEVDFTALDTVPPMPEAEKARQRELHRTEHLPAYEERVTALVAVSRTNGIEPVLITGPMLFGPVRDDVTGVNLGNLAWDYESGFRWELMELYNDVVRRVGQRDGVLVVDLARRLPKSSRLFYDNVHFTNAGAERVAEVVYDDLCPFLATRYPDHATAGCGRMPSTSTAALPARAP